MRPLPFTLVLLTSVVFCAYAQRTTGNSRGPSSPPESRTSDRPSRSEPRQQTPSQPQGQTSAPQSSGSDHGHYSPVGGGGFCGGVSVEPVVIVMEQSAATDQDEPEIIPQAVLMDSQQFPDKSGFDFSAEDVVPVNGEGMDMFFSQSEEGAEFAVKGDEDIVDLGQIEFDPAAKMNGTAEWSETRRVHAEAGNVYLVWTWDNQYFLFRAVSIAGSRASIEWSKIDGGARRPSDIAYRTGNARRYAPASMFGS